MKKLFAMGFAALLAAIAILAITSTAPTKAAVEVSKSLPSYWYDETGSNGFGLTISAVPNITAAGVKYSGITTNRGLVYSAGVSNVLHFVNGILVQME